MAAVRPTGQQRWVDGSLEIEFTGESLHPLKGEYYQWTAWYRRLDNGRHGDELVPGTLIWAELNPSLEK